MSPIPKSGSIAEFPADAGSSGVTGFLGIQGVVDEVALQRMIRLAEEAEQYEARLLEMAAQMKLYRQAHGKDAETTELLAAWAGTHLAEPIDPYEILTREEIVQVWEDAEDPGRRSR